MRRSLHRLSDQTFDVLVIGGGAAGSAAARESCLRGLRTALIEREDFGGGSSAHCFKVVHGGIRYVQHADVRRMRASCRERSVFLRIAPHLVAPVSFVIPTYGQGKNSKWFLGAGMALYDALTADCNAYVTDPARRIRRTRYLSRNETIEQFPEIERRGLTGAAAFQDGQMHNPPRLVLAFAAAAEELGATVANYVEAERFLVESSRVVGVSALDRLSGERFQIRARVVINATGPWAEGLLAGLDERSGRPGGTYSRDACFIVARKPSSMALAVQGLVRDADAVFARNARHLFLVPWRDRTLVGVWHRVVVREPDSIGLSWAELRQFIDEFNQCYPALQLKESEVRMADFGLVPFGEASRQQGGLSFGKQSTLIDHGARGLPGLISVISVRYTVARHDAVTALNLVERLLDRRSPSGAIQSGRRPLPGGDIPDFHAFLRDLHARRPEWLDRAALEQIARNYGTRAGRILALAESEPSLRRCLHGSHVTLAEVAYAVREEMAQCMTDVVFRRTELGTAGHPGEAAIEELAAFLKQECGWSDRRVAEERAAVNRHFERYLASAPPRPALARSA